MARVSVPLVLSDAFENLTAMLAAGGRAQPDMPVGDLRAGLDLLGSLAPEADGVGVETVDAGGVPADLHRATASQNGPVLIYFHGGGYVIGSPTSHNRLAGHLAAALGGTVVLVDYRLAPEHPAPAALDDAAAAYRWVIENSTPPERVVVGGESAGGGLAAALLGRLRDEGTPAPAAGVLLSPWADLTLESPSITANAETDLLLSYELLDHWADLYAVNLPRTDPRVSPVFGDWAGLPPLFVQVGTREILLDDARVVAARASAAGTPVELVEAEGMIHLWQLFAGMIPEADDAIAQIAEFVRTRML